MGFENRTQHLHARAVYAREVVKKSDPVTITQTKVELRTANIAEDSLKEILANDSREVFLESTLWVEKRTTVQT